MRDTKLLQLVQAFKDRGIENHPSPTMGYMAHALLAGILETHGVAVEIVESHAGAVSHCWFRLPDGRVLDPFPSVYLGPPMAEHARAVFSSIAPALPEDQISSERIIKRHGR